VHGCDISETALAFATERARRAGLPLRFYWHDVLEKTLPEEYDAVVSSLFLHHLEWRDAEDVLRCCAAAARGLVIVSDLDRSVPGLALAWLGTRLLSRSPVVHVDGMRSVRAAFTRAEARGLAVAAGFTMPGFHLTLASQWPCRWRLVAERSR
jgi:2-polyprenyl-3-methyl-5-hydroxy-6-metoxy-1,4-benzoquinol methylase